MTYSALGSRRGCYVLVGSYVLIHLPPSSPTRSATFNQIIKKRSTYKVGTIRNTSCQYFQKQYEIKFDKSISNRVCLKLNRRAQPNQNLVIRSQYISLQKEKKNILKKYMLNTKFICKNVDFLHRNLNLSFEKSYKYPS